MSSSSVPNESSIESLLRHFPTLDSREWGMLGEGFGSSVYEHREGNIVVRVARSSVAGHRMSLVMSSLEWIASSLPVAIPQPIWQLAPDVDASLPFGAFAYRKLTGDVLQPETVAEGTVESLTAVLIALHRLAIPESATGPCARAADVHKVRSEHYRQIRGLLASRLSTSEFNRIEAWRAQPVPESSRLTVIHGDFWHENILIDRESHRVTGVLDWENVAVGDPAQDLVPLRYLGDDIADRVLHGYLEAIDEETVDLERRMRWWWENRDFDGIYLAQVMNDEAEVIDGLRKLREGPILRSSTP